MPKLCILSSYIALKFNYVPMKHLLLLIFVTLIGLTASAQSATHQPDLSVFPNPTTEFISVSDQNELVGFIEVFTVLGRNVKKFEFVKGERYSVSDLPKGLYLVQIQDKNHKTLTTQKVEKR